MRKDSDDEDANRQCNCTDPGLCRAEMSRELDTVKKALLGRTAGARVVIGFDRRRAGWARYPTTSTCMSRRALTTPARVVVVDAGGAEAQKRICIGLMEKLDIIVRAGRFCKSVSGVFLM